MRLEQNGMTTLIMSDETNVLGLFGIADEVRKDSRTLIDNLKNIRN